MQVFEILLKVIVIHSPQSCLQVGRKDVLKGVHSSVARITHLIIERYSKYSDKHPKHIDDTDWITQKHNRYSYYKNSLGWSSNRIA